MAKIPFSQWLLNVKWPVLLMWPVPSKWIGTQIHTSLLVLSHTGFDITSSSFCTTLPTMSSGCGDFPKSYQRQCMLYAAAALPATPALCYLRIWSDEGWTGLKCRKTVWILQVLACNCIIYCCFTEGRTAWLIYIFLALNKNVYPWNADKVCHGFTTLS